MHLKKFMLASIFSLSLVVEAGASVDKTSQYETEIEKLEELENELYNLVKEAKGVLAELSKGIDEADEHSSEEAQSEFVSKDTAAEPEPETALAEKKDLAVEPEPETTLAEKEDAASEEKSETALAKKSDLAAEPKTVEPKRIEPRSEAVFTGVRAPVSESRPSHPFYFQGAETPWVSSAHDQNPNSLELQENIEEEGDVETSCSSCSSIWGNWCGDSVLLYADARLGTRPCFDGSIFTGGAMLFDDTFSRNCTTLFLDINGSCFNHSRSGMSVGIGSRFNVPYSNTIIGINTYFDYMDSSASSFRQVGFGFEWIKSCYSIRANGYIPAGRRKSCPTRVVYDDYEGGYVVTCSTWRSALKGYDVEFRRHICLPCDLWAYPAIGSYYLTGGNCSKLGVMGGAAISWRNIVSAEGVFYYDKCNKSKGEAYLSINLPLDFFCNSCRDSYCADNLKDRVRRRNYIASEEVCHYRTNY